MLNSATRISRSRLILGLVMIGTAILVLGACGSNDRKPDEVAVTSKDSGSKQFVLDPDATIDCRQLSHHWLEPAHAGVGGQYSRDMMKVDSYSFCEIVPADGDGIVTPRESGGDHLSVHGGLTEAVGRADAEIDEISDPEIWAAICLDADGEGETLVDVDDDDWTRVVACKHADGSWSAVSYFLAGASPDGSPLAVSCQFLRGTDGVELKSRLSAVKSTCDQVRPLVLHDPPESSAEPPLAESRASEATSCDGLDIDQRAALVVEAMNNQDPDVIEGCAGDGVLQRIADGPLPTSLRTPDPCEPDGQGYLSCLTEADDGTGVALLFTSGSAGESLHGWRVLASSPDGSIEALEYP